MESIASRSSVLQSMKSTVLGLIWKPRQYLLNRPSAVMLLLYSGTYATANSIDTLCAVAEDLPVDHRSSNMTKFCSVTAVNLCLSLFKDSVYARSYGTVIANGQKMRLATYGNFLFRDAITLFATFNAPIAVAEILPESTEQWCDWHAVAQLGCPVASQFIATPFHLLGVDLFYRSQRMTISDRLRLIRTAWFSTSVARACRVLPAYGIGGVINDEMRTLLLSDSYSRNGI